MVKHSQQTPTNAPTATPTATATAKATTDTAAAEDRAAGVNDAAENRDQPMQQDVARRRY